jgi:glycine/D-amino acid oxidase-like deaminating enzyme
MSNTFNRRTVLGAAGVAAAATSLPKTTFAAPAVLQGLPDVVVVGAGAFGGWTALNLIDQGANVTLVDQYGAGNVRGSSGGESRNIRASYGAEEIYTRMTARAWESWGRYEEIFQRRLLYRNGSLRVLRPDALAPQREIFDRLGLPYEMLDAAEVNRRWPQLTMDEGDAVFFERNSGSVKARESSIAVDEAFIRKGGVSRLGLATLGRQSSGRLDTVLVNGEPLSAGAFVFACGPWLPKVLPEVLKGYIYSRRAELFFVGSAPGDMRYRIENVPNITDRQAYTTADMGSGYKVGIGLPGDPEMDMDGGDRLTTEFLRERVEAYVARRLPGLVGQPIISAYVCQTENSNNHHFIIDRHPGLANAWIAGGGSGHGFKMGPVVGEVVAARVLGQPDLFDDAGAFDLSTHEAWK